ncbi:MAG: ABC transporter permease [bacterium]
MREGSWETLVTAFGGALDLVVSGDPQLFAILALTMQVSLSALLIATLLGIPLGAFVGLQAGPRVRRAMRALLYTGMGMPPVVVGLGVYLFLSRSGPLAGLEWLFTPSAMILAQSLLALPLVSGLTMAAVEGVDSELHRQLVSLGATRVQVAGTVLLEARGGVLAAIAAAFGGAISEVGAASLAGGIIAAHTRVLTTAIVLETRRGEFALALALGLVLLTMVLLVNLILIGFGEPRRKHVGD